MTKRRVEDSSFPVHLVPRYGEIVISSMHPRVVRVIQLVRIKAEQHVYLFPRPFLRLIDLVVLDELGREVANSRKIRILVDDGRVECHPGMLIEPSADHFSVFWPFIVCVERSVNADESLAIVFNER